MPPLSARKSFARRAALAAVAALVAAGCQTAPAPLVEDRRPLSDAERAKNVASFDEMWRRVDTTYFHPDRLTDPTVNWPGVREAFRPKVENASTQAEARAAMNDALARLRETHFVVAPGEDHRGGADAATQGATGFVGMELRPVSAFASRPMVAVWQVEPDSPAERAGVRPGWVLQAIDGRPVGNVPAAASVDQVRTVELLARQIAGSAGESHQLLFQLADGKTRRVTVESSAPPEGRLTRLGNLPAMDLRLKAETLPSGVGYFGFGVFLDPPRVMPAFQQFIEQHAKAPGLVIDLRGNPGGLGVMATGLCGFLVNRHDVRLGTMKTRDGTMQFVVNPRVDPYGGPVAVLVDGFSLSTSEILAGGLQDLGRARIFGQRTPGAALPSTVTRLPNGDLFQYAVADYTSAGGRRLEGAGVTPDVVVPLTRSDLLAGRDAPLEAAVAWILSKPTVTTQRSATP